MNEIREQIWRGKRTYLHPIRRSVRHTETKPSLLINKSLDLPNELDWDNPGELQKNWIDRIKRACSYAVFDSLQEYGIKLENGVVKKRTDGYNLAMETSLGSRVQGPLANIFPDKAEEIHMAYSEHKRDANGIVIPIDSNKRWHYLAYLEKNENKFRVIGGGFMHWCEGGRHYWSSMEVHFDSLEEARLFLKNLQNKPRLTMELYLRSLLGDNFPKDHYTNQTILDLTFNRYEFYPFDETHGKLNMFIKDLTLESKS